MGGGWRQLWAAGAGLLCWLGLAGAWWAWTGAARHLGDSPGMPVACVSFAPYGAGQSPFQRLDLPPEQIDADLAALRAVSRCVRTYSSRSGLEATAALAGRHGIAVALGAWIGSNDKDNRLEIEALIAAANAHPETVTRVIVGNEVLLRVELRADQLANYLDEVRARVKQPVTYADVWEFWLRNPQLADHVDFITVHILPFWEDEPVAVDVAIEHVLATYRQVRAAFAGREIFIGETGWPSAGRAREGARPGRIEQGRYVREFLAAASREGFDYSLIEAFDQRWKRQLEGTVGGAWGLLDAWRRPKGTLLPDVVGNPSWRWHAGLTAALALLATLVAWRRGGPPTAGGWFWQAGAATAVALALTLQARHVAESFHTPLGWLANLAGLAAMALLAAALLDLLRARFRGEAHPAASAVPVAETLAWLTRPPPWRLSAAQGFAALHVAIDGAALTTAAGLLSDPRYRDFPTALFLVPAFGLALRTLFVREASAAGGREEGLLALLYLGLALAIVLNEGPLNRQSAGFALVLLLMALPRARAARAT
ncbi:MAG: hypothetical protein FJX68_02170 [Alphaproteobacteria bacterium]|nr:hypothetical protein [Alphaproteobacteria bacterium]